MTWPGPSDPGRVYGSSLNSCRPLLAHLLADTVWVVSWPLDTAARTRPSVPSAAAVPLALGEGGGGGAVYRAALPPLPPHTHYLHCLCSDFSHSTCSGFVMLGLVLLALSQPVVALIDSDRCVVVCCVVGQCAVLCCGAVCCAVCCGAVCCGALCCGAVWCVVVWCVVLWCGVLCCAVWCGVLWCGVVWCVVVWCGVLWCGVVYGVLWCGVVCCGAV